MAARNTFGMRIPQWSVAPVSTIFLLARIFHVSFPALLENPTRHWRRRTTAPPERSCLVYLSVILQILRCWLFRHAPQSERSPHGEARPRDTVDQGCKNRQGSSPAIRESRPLLCTPEPQSRGQRETFQQLPMQTEACRPPLFRPYAGCPTSPVDTH